MSVRIEFDEKALKELDERLGRVSALSKGKVFVAAVREAGKPVVKRWKQLMPTGTKGDRGNRKKGVLRAAITVKAVDYDGGKFVAIVGANKRKAPHEHLVEEGHEMWVPQVLWKNEQGFRTREGVVAVPTGRKVPGKHYGRSAVEQTRAAQERALFKGLAKAIDREMAK